MCICCVSLNPLFFIIEIVIVLLIYYGKIFKVLTIIWFKQEISISESLQYPDFQTIFARPRRQRGPYFHDGWDKSLTSGLLVSNQSTAHSSPYQG